MKKLFATLLMLGTLAFVGSDLNTVSNGTAFGNPQIRIQLGQRRYRRPYWARGERIGYGRTITRDVWRGRHLFRETYQVRYLPNGMTQTILVSRYRLS